MVVHAVRKQTAQRGVTVTESKELLDVQLGEVSADEIEDVKAVPCTTEHEFEVWRQGLGGFVPDGSDHTGSPGTAAKIACHDPTHLD
jgi:hypothetical protein